MINTRDEKERLIATSNIDVLLTPRFDQLLRDLSAERFVEEILVDRLAVKHIVIGFDYAFGRDRKGDLSLLRRLGERSGFTVEALAPVGAQGVVYSSTRVRQMVAAGQVAEVTSQLGRHFNLEGTVVHGDGRGRSLGFATANLQTEKELLPADGVYAVKVRMDNQYHDGVVNIGMNPTFSGHERTIEVHLFDIDESLYRRKMRVYFLDRLRDEMRFDTPEALQRAIAADVATARTLLKRQQVIEFKEYLQV